MPFDLVDADGGRYRVPPSLTVNQLHVGGSPRVRFVRAYGAEQWFTVQDGIREPATINLIGVLATDRDEFAIQPLIDDLVAAAASATQLVQVDSDGVDVQALALLGSLPVTTSPDGIDGTLLTVTLPLIPDGEWEVFASPPAESIMWRVRYLTKADEYVSIAEIGFCASVGGPNLATDSSRGFGDPDSSEPGYAFDGDPLTYWESNSANPWVAYDFGAATRIAELTLTAGEYAEEMPPSLAVESSSDGVTWACAATVADVTPWTTAETRRYAL